MTILRGSHETRYSYAGSCLLGPHQLRLRPREDAWQRLRSFDLRISPEPQGQAWGTDAEGNSCLQVWWIGETHHLLVRTRFEVEVNRGNPFDFLITDAASSFPLRYGEREHAMAAVYLQDPDVPSIRSYADNVRGAGGLAPVPLLLELARRIHGEIRSVVRETGPPLAPAETLRQGEASCRDLAVLFNSVCRCWGIPARFVSGYERASALEDSGHMHAWSEVYLPVIGWRAFDPSRGLAVAEDHVTVAAALDPEGATPILGAFSGKGTAHMHYDVRLSSHA